MSGRRRALPAVFFSVIRFENLHASEMSTTDQGWVDYWQHDGEGGEVFVNSKGERHPALAEYWNHAFEGVAGRSRVIDIASGAGSIFAHLSPDHGLELFAADIAEEALEALKARIPGVTTVACPAEAVPYGDGYFDLVVSQFGIEYAGIEAFTEAGRLVAAGGCLAALCHVEDGYIDSNNKAQLEEARLVDEMRFIDLAKDLTRVAFSNDANAMQQSEAVFAPVMSKVAAGVERCPRGIHCHLFRGFRQLFEQRRAYDATDITTWLEQMRADLDKNIDRLSRMRAAALSKADVTTIAENLTAVGLQEIQFNLFATPGNELPVAWKLSAWRPAEHDPESRR
jgi:ubiquinone/menaquinone biosynthesis C-methylase UbiE